MSHKNFLTGWTPSPPDHRDRVYRAPQETLAALPAILDLTSPALPSPWLPIYDQMDLGACGAFSGGEDIVYGGLRQQSLPTMPKPSMLFIYYVCRMVMSTPRQDYTKQDSGIYNRALGKALATYGWCDEALWVYNTSQVFVKPPQAAFDQALPRKIDQYLSVPQDLDSMRACLAGGDTFIFGFTVYESFMTDQVAMTGIVPLPLKSEKVAGGHDILFVGYNDTTQMFKARNHWYNSPGVPWGDNGYAYIPYAYATNKNLSGDFWTFKKSGLPDPTPVPVPSPPPTPVPPTPVPIPVPSVGVLTAQDIIDLQAIQVYLQSTQGVLTRILAEQKS